LVKQYEEKWRENVVELKQMRRVVFVIQNIDLYKVEFHRDMNTLLTVRGGPRVRVRIRAELNGMSKEVEDKYKGDMLLELGEKQDPKRLLEMSECLLLYHLYSLSKFETDIALQPSKLISKKYLNLTLTSHTDSS
jgi:hypothetical protein